MHFPFLGRCHNEYRTSGITFLLFISCTYFKPVLCIFLYEVHMRKICIGLTFASSSLVILKPSVLGNIPHALMHSALEITDLFLSRTFWEWKRERESERVRGRESEKEREREEDKKKRGNEGWCNSLSGWRKETEITCFGIFFFFWGEAKIPEFHLIHKWFQLRPTEPANSSSVSGRFHQELLTKTDWSWFSSGREPANYRRRHEKKERVAG